ncbi:hypothetical protein T265_01539 [Opisthorchis viverrini]|uniref:Protein YIPF n=1 Tax=Opisthorchis viverrini TaxID=6198 RepID=A0A075A9A4_OPIVI|nr:hypothetical protein T265_01539 [Opisthorchis viverrini]KER32310.1 hypothetical protein T265_01539 [Opisthorchis viverrini]
MSLKFNTDDYVRVPLPSRLEANDSSDPELDGDIEPTVETTTTRTERVPNAWNIEFYQQHFDVDTHQVLRRLAFSVIPNPRSNFIQHVLKPRADLYGPFWIATTLILASAIGGNISSYLQSRGRLASWRYDFRKVTLASTVIYMYWWLVPLGIVAFFYMQSRKSNSSSDGEDQDPLVAQPHSRVRGRHTGVKAHNFVELLSVYGYSLTIFVPVSIAGPLIIGIVLLHCAFSVGLMMTFFPGSPSVVTTPVVAPVVPVSGAVPAGPVALDSAKADVPRAVPDPTLKDKEKIVDVQKTAR